MNEPALIGRRPCGCVVAIDEDPSLSGSKDRKAMEANGYTVTVHTVGEAKSLYAAAHEGRVCQHGTTQRQLAAKVKEQAARIADLERNVLDRTAGADLVKAMDATCNDTIGAVRQEADPALALRAWIARNLCAVRKEIRSCAFVTKWSKIRSAAVLFELSKTPMARKKPLKT